MSTSADRMPGSGAVKLLQEFLEVVAGDANRLGVARLAERLRRAPVDREAHRTGVADAEHGALADVVRLALARVQQTRDLGFPIHRKRHPAFGCWNQHEAQR